MKKRGTVTVAGVAVAVASLMVTSVPAEAAAGANMRVGIMLPLTGDLGTYGPSLANAAQLGVKMVNNSIKKNKLKGSCTVAGTEDDQTKPSVGVEAATKLVKSNKSNAIVGSMASSITLAVANSVTIPNNVILLPPTASSPAITTLKDKDTVFRVYPSDNLQGKALALLAAKAFGKTAKINLGHRNDAFGNGLADVFTEVFKANGGTINKEVKWEPEAASYDSEAQALAGGSPDGWVIIDFDGTFAKIAPALSRTGTWKSNKSLMTEGFNSEGAIKNVGAQYMEGVRGTSGAQDGASPAEFQAMFTKAYPKAKWNGFEGSAFDSAVLACLASVNQGSVRARDLAEGLRNVSGAEGGTQYTWKQLDAAVKAAASGKKITYFGAWSAAKFDGAGDPAAGVFDVYSVASGKPVINAADRIKF